MCCAGVVALLLLLQPLFCIISCVVEVGPGPQAAGGHVGHPGALLCHLSAPDPAAEMMTIPAFWPGVLPTVLMVVAMSSLISFVARPGPARPIARPIPPPIPPPRHPCAA